MAGSVRGLCVAAAAAAWALAGPLLLGIVDEVTQSLARNRSSDIWDLAADAVGITVAYACSMWAMREEARL
jgi:VanZ family protein